MHFLADLIESYTEQHTEQEPNYLHELYRETHIKVLNPRMASGAYQGRLIKLLGLMIQPSLIVELGTFTGYSTICWAETLIDTGKIITVDVNEELVPIQQKYFERAGVANKITAVVGNGIDLLAELKDNSVDVLFIDANKNQYLEYYELGIQKIKSGGYIIVDNVLWNGKVVDESATDFDTDQIKSLNQTIQNDARVFNVLLPVRDGLMIARKH
jgi:predicted O-methyltransferase YrrM